MKKAVKAGPGHDIPGLLKTKILPLSQEHLSYIQIKRAQKRKYVSFLIDLCIKYLTEKRKYYRMVRRVSPQTPGLTLAIKLFV